MSGPRVRIPYSPQFNLKDMSGLYNLINGVNPATFFILPMLGKHPDEYPRFRDCFVSDDNTCIEVLTRVGGGNRDCGYGEEELMKHPNFIKTYDWDEDNTYGWYIFSVPEKWKEDFDKIINGSLAEISDEYFNEMIRVYPKLEDKFREMFERPV